MKKLNLIIFVLFLMILLSSCSLFCTHEYEEKVVASTCVTEGYTEHTCKHCSDSYKDNYQPFIQHYFLGGPCTVCGMKEITDNITPNTEWYSEETAMFTLTTKEELAGLASLVNSGTDFKSKIVYLGSDIDLGYYEWIPIGNSEHAFNGKFDADGHTVSSLKINAKDGYVGLFGNSCGQIINLNINNASIFADHDYKYVSIVCGYTVSEITNVSAKGFVEAAKSNFVGAIAGAANPGEMVYSKLYNFAAVKGADYVGGIMGEVTSNGIVQTDKITNTGDVTGASQVGGIFGHIGAKVGSSVYSATSSADIVGEYYVGGIVGKADSVSVSYCSNEGSTVTANSYFTEGSNFYVWLGGYVGYGYNVDNCTNDVNITYTARGSFIGGIIGFSNGEITNCTNNGNIESYANDVGGIVGKITDIYGKVFTYQNLKNNGNVKGNNYVAGIVGYVYRRDNLNWNDSGFVVFDNVDNNGDVCGIDNVGGIIGFTYLDDPDWYEINIRGTKLTNKGSISGENYVGELIGHYNFADGSMSSVSDYTVTGKITVKGDLLEGEYDIGSDHNLTLTDRKVDGQ